jgi:hypothetical protein
MRLMGHDAHAYARPRPARGWIATLALAGALAFALLLGAGAANAAPKTVVLGAATPALPACPDSCQAIGRTTGFQNSIGRSRSPFRVPYAGKIVAWSIKLSRPNAKQIEFFDDFFGGTPSARISVLKPVMSQIKKGKPIFELKSQSPVEQLNPYLGTTTTFALQRPLKVKTSQIVALTVPTWAPAFAVNLGGNTAWQASRKRSKCNAADDIKAGKAQQALGSDRAYGCVYKTARLLYSATVVKKP